ncbi:MAG: aldehyde dehydrogenase, partial [Mesorhizobium sp.]
MEFSADRPTFFLNPDYRPMTGAAKPVIDPATLETVGAIAAATDGEIDAVLA